MRIVLPASNQTVASTEFVLSVNDKWADSGKDDEELFKYWSTFKTDLLVMITKKR